MVDERYGDISTVNFLRIDFHSVVANFYITLIGVAVLLAMFYLHYQRRAAAIPALAARLGFEYHESMPPSLNLRGTGLNSATSGLAASTRIPQFATS